LLLQTLKTPALAPRLLQAPCVPLALAVTTGIVADRYASIPPAFSLVCLFAALVIWLGLRRSRRPGLPLVYLGIAAGAFGAAYHHLYREGYSDDDIGEYATPDPRPVRVRGVLVEEPVVHWKVHGDPLRSRDSPDPAVAVLEVKKLRHPDDWRHAGGRARLVVEGSLSTYHAGDEVEITGRLAAPRPPANPGESDYASALRDQRIRAVVSVQHSSESVRLLHEGWRRSLAGWLGVVRGWGQRVLAEALPPESAGVATALLLGEGSPLTTEDWQKYQRTGVIHVLAVSGQHLVVLAAFLWFILKVLMIRRSHGALTVALVLLAYALLTGGRPPVMRSVVMVGLACGAILLGRQANPANSFALAWLTVALLSPTDLFNYGCQLSFLSVAVLYWGSSSWLPMRQDPLVRMIEASRPTAERWLRRWARLVIHSYAVSFGVWLAVAPLIAARYHLVAPVGVPIGPPVVLLTSIALVSGFLLLLSAVVSMALAQPFAWLTNACLTGCESLVNLGERMPGGYWYVTGPSDLWLWVFYVGLLAFLMLEPLRQRWRWVATAGIAWLGIGLIFGGYRPAGYELRCTFLAVGHGGCTVLETTDGHVLLYDAGAMGGPDVTQRVIAPFLWERGVSRIDEVFLSHADLDHFNGLPALLERFAVGQVSCTPTFADKAAPGVPVTLAAIERHRIPVRIVKAGNRLRAGDVELNVLHPPAAGPPGRENFRSLVLEVRHAGHVLLLTGDLEGPGLAKVVALPPNAVDVLMAPHHGSRAGDEEERRNRAALAALTRPGVIISCQGLPRGALNRSDPYAVTDAPFLGTWPHGAVTVRSRPESLTVETFQTNQRLDVARRRR
jgi:competence protein ComEC